MKGIRFGALLLAVVMLAAPFPPAAADATWSPAAYMADYRAWRDRMDVAADHLPELERAALDAVNDRRAEAGLKPLEADRDLAWIARFTAAEMARTGRFDHVDQVGRGPGDRIAALDRRFVGLAGENLFQSDVWQRGRLPAAGRLATDSLMESPGHRANILDPRWTRAGFGALPSGDAFILVQLFAVPVGHLDQPLPTTLAGGSRVAVALEGAPAEGAPTGVRAAFLPIGRAPSGADFAATDVRVPPGPGLFRLHLAVPLGTDGPRTRFDVHPGPLVEVE